jgi:lysozyme family protein
MADFEKAYSRTGKFEGGYVNDPDDSGGETYHGIARKFHPTWPGWKIVDEQKKKSNFPKNLKDRRNELLPLEKVFYKKEFWDKVWGDSIKDQRVANDMYDTAVNMGVGTSIKLSQRQFKMKETSVMSTALLSKLNSVI